MPGFKVLNFGDGPSNELEPFMTYTWEIPMFLGWASGRNDTSCLIFLKECTLPTFSAGREEIEGASLKYKFAGTIVWEDVRVTFYDIPQYDGTLSNDLKTWRTRVWTPEGGVGSADQYKFETIINVFNLTDTARNEWHLYNSWPQSIREGELTYTNSEVKVVEVVICYDWAEVNPTYNSTMPTVPVSMQPPSTAFPVLPITPNPVFGDTGW